VCGAAESPWTEDVRVHVGTQLRNASLGSDSGATNVWFETLGKATAGTWRSTIRQGSGLRREPSHAPDQKAYLQALADEPSPGPTVETVHGVPALVIPPD
jgi:hypothetical protein